MKQIITGLFIVVFVFTGCGKVKVYPTSALELTAGGLDCPDAEALPATSAQYSNCSSFENGSMNNLQIGQLGDAAFTAISNSTEKPYKGTQGLKLLCNFTGTNAAGAGKGGLARTTGGVTAITMTGKTITAYIWVPNGMFTETLPYGAVLFVQTSAGGWKWYSSAWQNLNMPTGSVAGIWNKFTAKVDDMVDDPAKVQITTGQSASVYRWGLQISKGGNAATPSVNFNGTIYIDSISVE